MEREDYDMAKALKQDIHKLRAAGEAAATGHMAQLPKSRRATDPEEIFNRVLGRSDLSGTVSSLHTAPLRPAFCKYWKNIVSK